MFDPQTKASLITLGISLIFGWLAHSTLMAHHRLNALDKVLKLPEDTIENKVNNALATAIPVIAQATADKVNAVVNPTLPTLPPL